MQFVTSALRIGIAVAAINGTVRVGAVYWSFFQFQDAAQQLAIHGAQITPDALRSNAYVRAAELLIPISEDQIVVSREGTVTRIEASYQHPVEYFPHQSYPLKLSFKVEGRDMTAPTAQ